MWFVAGFCGVARGCSLFVCCCMLRFNRWLLFVVCCVLFGVACVSLVARLILFGAY